MILVTAPAQIFVVDSRADEERTGLEKGSLVGIVGGIAMDGDGAEEAPPERQRSAERGCFGDKALRRGYRAENRA